MPTVKAMQRSEWRCLRLIAGYCGDMAHKFGKFSTVVIFTECYTVHDEGQARLRMEMPEVVGWLSR